MALPFVYFVPIPTITVYVHPDNRTIPQATTTASRPTPHVSHTVDTCDPSLNVSKAELSNRPAGCSSCAVEVDTAVSRALQITIAILTVRITAAVRIKVR